MDKKGLIWETITDVFLGGLILFMGVSVFFMFSGISRDTNPLIEQKILGLNDDEIFISYLSARSSDQRIGYKII